MCCPGTNDIGSGHAKKKLVIRGVRGTIAVTFFGFQSSFPDLDGGPTDAIPSIT
jgi:hypothetical protein